MDHVLKVLLIEDYAGDARLIQEMLREVKGIAYQVIFADRLEAGVQAIQKESPDAILLDLTLPDSSSLGTFYTVHNQASEIPIIVLSGTADEELATQAVQGGAQDYLVKGQVDSDLLVRSIRYAIERKRVETALRTSEGRYRLLAENISDVLWTMDMDLHFTDATPSITRLLGYSAAEVGHVKLDKLLSPGSLKKVRQVIKEEIQQGKLRAPRDPFWSRTLELEQIRKDGSVVWAEVRISFLYDQAGQPTGIMGVSRDITDRKTAAQALEESEKRYRAIVEDQTELICRFLPDGTISFLNEAFCRYFGVTREEALGRSYTSFVQGEDQELVRSAIAWISLDRSHITYEHQVVSAEGKLRWLQRTDRGIYDSSNGALMEYQSVARDITIQKEAEMALQQANDNLRAMAVRDSLTGLFNRRYMQETLEREISRAERNHSSIGIIMMDIDHFKNINDHHGHAAGDEALRKLGDLLRSHTRNGDVACRFGGEEFVLILAGATLDHTAERAEQFCQGIRDMDIAQDEKIMERMTVSVGVVAYPEHGATLDELLQTADAALYKAKSLGRNRVVVGDPPPA